MAELGTRSQLTALFETYGVQRALVIQPHSGFDILPRLKVGIPAATPIGAAAEVRGSKAGLPVASPPVKGNVIRWGPFAPTLEGGAAAADIGAASGTTALVAFNDLLAIGVLQHLGIDVPGYVSVVGFEDIFGSDFCHPPFTTVTAPAEQVGRWERRGGRRACTAVSLLMVVFAGLGARRLRRCEAPRRPSRRWVPGRRRAPPPSQSWPEPVRGKHRRRCSPVRVPGYGLSARRRGFPPGRDGRKVATLPRRSLISAAEIRISAAEIRPSSHQEPDAD